MTGRAWCRYCEDYIYATQKENLSDDPPIC